jgi:hypothetical protein
MDSINKFLAATFLPAAMLLTIAAQAMTIQQFDKMADQDQAEYVGLLVQGAEKVLTDEGRLIWSRRSINFFQRRRPATT